MKTEPKTEVVFQEENLQTVLNHYAKDFQPGEGKEVHLMDTFVDPAKGKVVFKLLVKEN